MKNNSAKHLFGFCFLISVSISVSAQRFKPGIIAGLVASDVVGVDPYDNDYHKLGATFGASLNTRISEKNSFQFEILYTRKGSLQKPDSLNNFTFYRVNLDYVEVPLILKHHLKFNINKKPVDRFYFDIGPSFGRLVRVAVNTQGSTVLGDASFKKNEIALNAGIGCKLLTNLFFDVRYSNSIIPVVKHPEMINSFFWYTFNKGDNTVFSFSLRYVFGRDEDKNENNAIISDH